MKYGEIKRTWSSILLFLGFLWLICIIFAGLYFITKLELFGLLLGLSFIIACSLSVGTIAYNVVESAKEISVHGVKSTLSKHEQKMKLKENTCEICGKQTKITWSGALRVCEECKKDLE